MIADLLDVDRVAGELGQRPQELAVEVVHAEVVAQEDATLVEGSMVIGTEAQDVSRCVWTVVRATKSSNVGGFHHRANTSGDGYAQVAHLA